MGATLNWLTSRWTGYRIDPREEQLWESAASLADVGERTAQWLEGRIAHQPGYCAPVDVDEDDVPGLADLLAACCRAGFATRGSQAGYAGPGHDGQWWEQRAAVEGFADDQTRRHLADVAGRAGLLVQWGRAGRRLDNRMAVPVTTRAGRWVTGFGAILDVDHLADGWTGYGICQPSAVAELIDSWQVLVYDPEWGSNDRLWPALARFVDGG